MKLLLVENNPTFAAVVVPHFLSAHEVATEATIEGAARRLHRGVFGVILVDLDLDDGKGDALVRELRARGVSTRIVAISSHAEGNAALLEAGANACCPKLEFSRIAAVLS